MAKTPKPEIDAPVVLMRWIGPERFEVVEGVVRGELVITKRLERSVSMMVATDSAKRALNKLHSKQLAAINPMMERAS